MFFTLLRRMIVGGHFAPHRTAGVLIILATQLQTSHAQVPEWIWFDNKGVPPADNEVSYFRKTFSVSGPVKEARLIAAGDDQAIVYINGERVVRSPAWNRAARAEVTRRLKQGENLITAWAKNNSGDAAFIARLDVVYRNGEKQTLVSDRSWVAADREFEGWQTAAFDAQAWSRPVSRGKLGVMPWGDVMAPPQATPAARLRTLPGFKVELLRSAQPDEGSWVCMAIDPEGRLIVSPQEGGLLRMTLDAGGGVAKVEPILAPLKGAMGLLWAYDSLYVSAEGPQQRGLYRLRDKNGNDQFDEDEAEFMKRFQGSGEHGPHGIALGPDGMLYIMNGNHTKVPEGISPNSPHKGYAEDLLLPRMWDAGGHAVGIVAPGGHVLRTDPDGKRWDLWCAGFRNAYDLDFNADGELFTFDSDMEWDWGTPWYRPTRVYHLVSGGEYGWRSGSGKWPKYYPDTLPGILDVGIGSPTGVKFGTGANFPAEYQQAFYILDWSYGRIIAVHLNPHGASYTASMEPFIAAPSGTPLNVADVEIGTDGAMYFVTGGRGTQSGLYRVSYTEALPEAPAVADAEEFDEQQKAAYRALRQRLESYHGPSNPAAIHDIWRFLNNSDLRRIRYAARIALEWQDVELWKGRAFAEPRTDTLLAALTAMARVGKPDVCGELLNALGRLKWEQLSEDQQLRALRILGLTFIRMGAPDDHTRLNLLDRLEPLFPARSSALNRELSELLVYLRSPQVVAKCMDLLARAVIQEEQLHYIFILRNVKQGWTMDQRRAYFNWFNWEQPKLNHPTELLQWFQDVGRPYTDGASYNKFLVNIKREVAESLSPEEREELQPILDSKRGGEQPAVRPRQFVKQWTTVDVAGHLDETGSGRSFESGKEAFLAAQCLSCHRFGNEGGSVGPDLTSISSRFSRADILDSIVDPSKVVSDQYQNITLLLKDGSDVTGRIIDETDRKIVVLTNPLTLDRVEVAKGQIESRRASTVSPMPDGLVDVLNRDEILDLMAYLESGGNPNAPMFERRGK